MTPFLKMHGLGNDFVIFDARNHPLTLDDATARAVADRRFGIGCDQVIVIGPRQGQFDATMRIMNADGREVESCGNASRCVALLLFEELDRDLVTIDTIGGALICTRAPGDNVTVDMGKPRTLWNEVPMAKAEDTNQFWLTVDGIAHNVSAISVGNPHVVLFVDNAEHAPVAELGARIEHHRMFPERTNVEFVSLEAKDRLRMRVWERGVGITSACGTGACASAAAAFRRGIVGRKVDVILDGGLLAIEQRELDGHVLMTGPATLAFKGEVEFEDLLK